MRTRLLGLPLDGALALLREAGIEPQVVATKAPRRDGEAGALRVVSAAQDGSRLIVSRFLDPLADPPARRPDSEP